MNDMRPPSALLEALQREDSPSPADASRVRDRVMLQVGLSAATIAAASGLSQTSAAATTAAATTATSSFGVLKALLVVGGLTGVVGSAAVLMSEPKPISESTSPASSTASQTVSSAEKPVSLPPPVAEVAEEDAQATELSASDEVPTAVDKAIPRVRPTSKATTNPASHLAEEARLLSQAQAALQKGQPQSAIAALNEHRQNFPQGALRGEREAALTVAYCQSGDLARGQSRALQFVTKNPQSPMVQRLRSACKLEK